MNFSWDFAAILVGLTVLTGVIWAIDALFFERARLRRAGIPSDGLSPNRPKDPIVVEYAKSFFPVILIVLLIRSFLAEPFRIPSSSMVPTLLVGDFILVNKFAYGLRWPVLNRKFVDIGEPARGDVVVFRGPKQPEINFIKRVVGMPGDTIEFRDRQLIINGEPAKQVPLGAFIGEGSNRDPIPRLLLSEQLPGREHKILHAANTDGYGYDSWQIPDGNYLVMGDNRDNSSDSRAFGLLPEENLVGKAMFVWLHIDWSNFGAIFSRVGTSVN
jgi:signal peptidase I